MSDYKQTEFFPASTHLDSPARTSQPATPEQQESTGIAPHSGRRRFDSLEMYRKRGRPPFVLLKTWLPYAVAGLPWSYKISGRSGTMRNGTLYPLPTWVRPTSAKGCGLWPTPTVQDSENDAGPSQWKRNSYPLNVEVHRADGRTATTKTGQLNPQFVEYLMGYPIGWTDLED